MKRFSATFIICFLVTLAGCGGGQDSASVIAVVNGRDITRAEFEQFLALKLGEIGVVENSDALRSQLLDEYIRRRIVLGEAESAGIDVSDQEIEQAALDNPLAKARAAKNELREELARDILLQKYYRQVVLRDVKVSSEEIQQHLDQSNAQRANVVTFYVREIRVQSKEEAERLRREVTEGRKDFATVARLNSEAANAELGGLSRYEKGQLPESLEKAIEPLRPGDVSPIIQSNFGFHIFKLDRRVEADLSEERRAAFDDRRATLIEELIARKNQQAIDAAIDSLVASASVKINEAALGFAYSGRLLK